MTIHVKVAPQPSWGHPAHPGGARAAPRAARGYSDWTSLVIDTPLPLRVKSVGSFLPGQTCWSQVPVVGGQVCQGGAPARAQELWWKCLVWLFSATLSDHSSLVSAPATLPNTFPLGAFTQGVPEWLSFHRDASPTPRP